MLPEGQSQIFEVGEKLRMGEVELELKEIVFEEKANRLQNTLAKGNR